MKAHILKPIAQAILLISSLFLMACGGGGGGGGKVVSGGPSGVPNNNSGFVTQGLDQIIQSVNMSMGRRTISFFQNNFAQQNIDNLVMQFLFPNGQAAYQVSQVSNIELNIDLGNLANTGQLTQELLSQNSSQIQMYLRIDDSFSSTGQDDPIFTGFGKGTLQSASINAGRMELVFGDSYGSFKVVSVNGQVTISFINSGQPEQVLATGFGNL